MIYQYDQAYANVNLRGCEIKEASLEKVSDYPTEGLFNGRLVYHTGYKRIAYYSETDGEFIDAATLSDIEGVIGADVLPESPEVGKLYGITYLGNDEWSTAEVVVPEPAPANPLEDCTPVSWSDADLVDYEIPAGATCLEVSATKNINVTGFEAPTGDQPKHVTVFNLSNKRLRFQSNENDSAEANRLLCPRNGDWSIWQYGMITFYYHDGLSRWVMTTVTR